MRTAARQQAMLAILNDNPLGGDQAIQQPFVIYRNCRSRMRLRVWARDGGEISLPSWEAARAYLIRVGRPAVRHLAVWQTHGNGGARLAPVSRWYQRDRQSSVMTAGEAGLSSISSIAVRALLARLSEMPLKLVTRPDRQERRSDTPIKPEVETCWRQRWRPPCRTQLAL